ncbi:hypothetical protein SeLEV6574_g01327 [Synchytrium endobioticum]|uniref:Uncharacterized protein n=1 Tax=Synchytrium endobioticum TaxID=286115 RepID=A0A507DDA0_9FUNG|nr:hypothetical protein SeLEV6574_g01327 [Synchytrium endobioticum]
MPKSMNINVVLYVTAVILIFRSAQGALIPEDTDIKKMIVEMQRKATCSVYDRGRGRCTALGGGRVAHIPNTIEKIVSEAIPKTSPYTSEQLLNEPNEETMPDIQRKFTKVYHALVFERLKTLFIRLQLLAHDGEHEEKDPLLSAGLGMVWSALLKHYALESGGRHEPIPSLDKISSYNRKIAELEQKFKNKIDAIRTRDHNRQFHSATIRRVLNSEESRFRVLEATKKWSARWDYGVLNQLALENRRWLPLCLAHERLIVARAQYDLARTEVCLIKYRYKGDASKRLYEYAAFIEDYKRKINACSESLRELGVLERSCRHDEIASSSKGAGSENEPVSFPSTADAIQRQRPPLQIVSDASSTPDPRPLNFVSVGEDGEALVRARSAMAASSSISPGRYSNLGPHTLNDRTYVLDRAMLDDSGHRQPQTLNLLEQLDTRTPQHDGSLQPVEIRMLDRSSDVDTDMSLGLVSTADQSYPPPKATSSFSWLSYFQHRHFSSSCAKETLP